MKRVKISTLIILICNFCIMDMSKKTLAVDSDLIDLAVSDLNKLIFRLEKNPKKTRKDQSTIKKIQEIRDTIQDSVLFAKLKKSVE